MIKFMGSVARLGGSDLAAKDTQVGEVGFLLVESLVGGDAI